MNSGRTTLSTLGDTRTRVATLDSAARSGVEQLRGNVQQFVAMRDADLAYARSLLRLPSLDAPTISPALFGETAVSWLKPVLYWVKTAERYLPPGLDPKRYAGPKRARARGTTVTYPGRAMYPRFLLQYAETDLEIGGAGAAAGQYAALIRSLSSAPALYQQPVEIRAGRTAAARGPRELRLAGTSEFTLDRNGDQISARLFWVSSDVNWERLDRQAAAADASLQIGSTAWAKDLLWRTLSGLRRVEVDMRLRGSLDRPRLSVSSNLGDAVVQSLRQELGREIERAEQQVRAQVDRLAQPRVAEARARVDSVRVQVQDVVAARLREVEEVRQRLENELRNLTKGIPGIRFP